MFLHRSLNTGIRACICAIERPLLILVAAIAIVVLAFWMVPAAAALAPAGWSQMTPATAIGMLMATAGLVLAGPGPRSPRNIRLAGVLAVAVIMLGITTLLGDLIGATAEAAAALHFPSPQTAIGFILVGGSLLFIRQTEGRLATLADLAALVLVALLFVLLGGHVFRFAELVGVGDARLTSLHTLFCFLLLAFVISARRAMTDGRLSVLVDGGHGSRIARAALPFVVTAPFAVFALVAVLDAAGVMPAAESRAIIAPAVVLAVAALVGWMGTRMNVLETDLRRLSLTDDLTQVLNRRGFEAVGDYVVQNAIRSKTVLSVLFFDLDGLKRINDTSGHEAGSALIRQFGEMLTATFRKADVVARFGGDEFVVLATGSPESMSEMIRRLDLRVLRFNAANPSGDKLHFSVGISPLDPERDARLDVAVAEADKRMYAHKRSRRSKGKVRAAA